MQSILSRNHIIEITALLHQTRYAMVRAREQELRPLGISNIEAATLFSIIAIVNEATPAEISRWVFREPHSVSRLISRMEKDGLVTKSSNLARKNLVKVDVTEKGLRVFKKSKRWKSYKKILSVLSEEEFVQLRVLLDKLLGKALIEIGKNRPPFPPRP